MTQKNCPEWEGSESRRAEQQTWWAKGSGDAVDIQAGAHLYQQGPATNSPTGHVSCLMMRLPCFLCGRRARVSSLPVTLPAPCSTQ